MVSEETPLLDGGGQVASVYDRFSKNQKRAFLATISWTALLPLFVSGSFIPSIPQISKDLDSTPQVISLAVSISIFATAIGSLTCATYSTFYGRRPIFLFTLPLLTAGSVGVSLSRTVPELMTWRFLQAFGSSGGFAVGSGVIADIYKLEERGTAMGIFYGAAMLGPSLAPICGGLAAHYGSWRYMQLSIGISGFLAFLLVVLFLSETSHPQTRGIDKYIESLKQSREPRRRFIWLNPLSSLWLLRSPNLLAVCIAGTFALLTDFVLLLPLAYTIGQTYNITNEALIGACFLPSGLGNMAGGVFSGRISDRIVIKWRQRRGGIWVPEDRLRASLLGGGIFLPLSVLLSGITIRYIGGVTGISLNLILLFFNGVGITSVLTTAAAYSVDTLHARSAEAFAASNGFRSIVLSICTIGILPLIESIGSVGTNAISAGLAWIGFGLICLTIRYGDKMRAWLDVGYSNSENDQ